MNDKQADLRGDLDARFANDWSFDVQVTGYQSAEASVTGRLVAGGRLSTSIELLEESDAGQGAQIDDATAKAFASCVRTLLSGDEKGDAGPHDLFGDNYDEIDVVTRRVIGGGFNAIAREMAQVLYRMSNSSIIRESEDLGCGIFDAEGRELCESESSPMHIGSLPAYIRGFMERLRGNIHEGDIILHNHPYFGASHTPDMCVALPIFHDGKLLGFAASTAHLIDTGAAAPGLNIDLIDVFAEGTLFNAVKLYERGVRNEGVWSLLRDSVRTPDSNAADVEAMIAAVHLGHDRFLKLVDRYGVETVLGTAYYWMDYSERRLRAEIEKVPDGEYHCESWLDDDGRNWGTPLKVNVTVTIRGSDVTIDLTGSADEVETGYNVPFEGSLKVACYYIIRTLMLDEVTTDEFVPQNEGMFRPVEIIAPKGSIFNPNFPRACFARMAQIQRVLDCVIRALAPVIPDRVTAGNAATVMSTSYSGIEPGDDQYWVCVEVNEGSYGGRASKDGLDSVDNLMANTRNVPVEEIEMRFPLRIDRYELRDEEPGAGRNRGGIGAVRDVRFLTDGFISCNGDRLLEAPVGVFDGQDGLPGKLTHNPGTDSVEEWPSKASGKRVDAGDVIRVTGPNSGGYGDPVERRPEQVMADVLDGYISDATARDTYKVVIDRKSQSIDEEATAKLRDQGHG
jgi:N-methylhydantoinase B/oxoprolinase/acetone carboxylase alpha subunit